MRDVYKRQHQFCQLLGRMRLYHSLPQGYQKDIPKMLLTDTQVNKMCIRDRNHRLPLLSCMILLILLLLRLFGLAGLCG